MHMIIKSNIQAFRSFITHSLNRVAIDAATALIAMPKDNGIVRSAILAFRGKVEEHYYDIGCQAGQTQAAIDFKENASGTLGHAHDAGFVAATNG